MIEDSTDRVVRFMCEEFSSLNPKVLFHDKAFAFIRMDAFRIMRGLTDGLAVFVTSHENIMRSLAGDLHWIDRRIGSLGTEFPPMPALKVLLVYGRGPMGDLRRAIVGTVFAEQKYPVLSYSAVEKQLGSVRSAVSKLQLLLREAPIGLLNPYQIRQVADSRMFFGRRRDVQRLLQVRSHVFLLGPRRIGKSSLGREIQRRLGNFIPGEFSWEKGLAHSQVRKCCYVDVSRLGNRASEEIWQEILAQFGFRAEDFTRFVRVPKLLAGSRSERRIPLSDPVLVLERLISKFPSQLTIILDEVDQWLTQESQTGWTALNTLRAITEDKARVIFVGYQVLSAATRSDEFPFWERGSTHMLGPLSRDEIDKLVSDPLGELGILLQPAEGVLNRIWHTSSGYPHIVQDICYGLVEVYGRTISATSRKRTLGIDELDAAILGSDAATQLSRARIGRTFPLAEAISGIISLGDTKSGTVSPGDAKASPARRNVSNQAIIDALSENKIFAYNSSEFDLALTYLEVRGVIRAMNIERTHWSYVNEIARASHHRAITFSGYRNWLADIIGAHCEGKWRAKYAMLGKIDKKSDIKVPGR
jgi:hypothetical protein